MPFLYALGKIVVRCPLDRKENAFIVKEWAAKQNEKVCEDYGHPKISFGFLIENPEEEISPWLFHLTDQDVDGGQVSYAKDGLTYTFTADGKFKLKVHKDIPKLIDSGKIAACIDVAYMRHGHPGVEIVENSLKFSSKKL
jgi:hypothetical protein